MMARRMSDGHKLLTGILIHRYCLFSVSVGTIIFWLDVAIL